MDIGAKLSIFSTLYMGIFIEAVSFLLLGSVVSGLIEVFVRKEDITRLIPRNPIKAVLVGGFLGFLFPVCECGVIPVTRRLYQKGLPVSVGITFLLAAPVMNPIVLASTYAAFGFGPILVGRYVITLIMAVVIGALFTLQRSPQKILGAKSLASIAGGSGNPGGAGNYMAATDRMPFFPGLVRAMRLATDDFFEIGRYLIIGCALAAGMQTFIQQDALVGLARHPVLSVLATAALAFILSLCSTTDAIIALTFRAQGFTSGSILTFLTFGPMVDIKSTLMYLTVFKRKPVLYMIVVPLLMAILVGIWLNLNVRF